MRDDVQPRQMRAGSFSERDIYGERERMERERYLGEKERERYDKVRERERSAREQAAREGERERQQMERQREREQQERERRERGEREREREQRERDREREQRDRESRGRERFGERDRFGVSMPVSSTFGRERMELHNPQTSSSHPPYGMTITSKSIGNQNGMAQSAPPQPTSISTPSSMSLHPSYSQGFGSHQVSGQRDGFPFNGYSVTMPPSPFSNSPSLPLPAVGDDARDRDARPQRFKPARDIIGMAGGRDEPLRAEDALQRGLNRSLSSLMEDDKKRNVGKDRDGIVRDKDGIMRLTDSALAYHSPPRRGLGLGERTWGEHIVGGVVEKDGRERMAMGMKRDREDDDSSSKAEKKKRHHHHHKSVTPVSCLDPELTSSSHLPHYHHHHDEPAISHEAPKISVARSKSPLHPHHHHAHAHIHHHHSPMPTPQHHSVIAPNQPPFSKVTTTLLIDSSKVLASLTSKPRNYLGSIVYLPTPTPKEGYSVTQPLLPRFEGRENSIFQVRIPKRFLADSHRRDVSRRRCVWGTEIYTDDSDVLAALVHTGKIPGYIPEDVDTNLVKETGRKVVVKGSISGSKSPSPPASGKWKINGTATAITKRTEEAVAPTIPAGKDLLVNLLILPTLERYSGSVRNALKSRSWNTVHDGMSYSIWDME